MKKLNKQQFEEHIKKDKFQLFDKETNSMFTCIRKNDRLYIKQIMQDGRTFQISDKDQDFIRAKEERLIP